MGRAAALLALAAAVGAYYATVSTLPTPSLWWEVAWLGVVVIPAVCGLIALALPLTRLHWVVLVAGGGSCFLVAALFGLAGLHEPANFAKLAATPLFAWAFLYAFEDVSLVVLVACVIPWVDVYSVFRGPTKTIVNHHESVFTAFSIAFPLPDGTTHLGLPDIFFFSVFLGAAYVFGLRVFASWLFLSLSFGVTLALTVWWNLGGLPALPALSIAFLATNADLLWRRLRPSRQADSTGVAVDQR